MLNPSFTIAIPVYERIQYFQEALGSALAVKGCTEVLVVDDNSNHNQFEKICSSYNDIRIKYIKNEINQGLFGNWNKCVDLAEGEFISILCSDDLIESNAYQLFLSAYQKNQSIDLFFGSFATFINGKEDANVHRKFKSGEMNSMDLLADAINQGPCFPVLSITRKEVLQKSPFFSKPHSGNDWLWIYTNALSINLFASNKTINYWRRHPLQDAVLSQSITMDCWPLMFKIMSQQLENIDGPLSRKAIRRAKGVILSWFINEYKGHRYWQKRLINSRKGENIFVDTILEIVQKDWLLASFLKSGKLSYFIYQLGRFVRKVRYYPI